MTDKVKKLVLLNLPYLIFVYLFDKLCQGVRLAPGADASEKLLHIGQGFSAAFASLVPSFHLVDLCVGAAGTVLIRLVVYSKGKNAQKYRRGIEYGSALVIGGSGSGKTRFFVKPNLIQCHSSYVVTDPSPMVRSQVGDARKFRANLRKKHGEGRKKATLNQTLSLRFFETGLMRQNDRQYA